MGCGGDVGVIDNNEQYKKRVNKDFRNKIDDLMKEDDINKSQERESDEEKSQNALERKKTVDENKNEKKLVLYPQEIQKLKDDNDNKNDEINLLKDEINDLKEEIDKLKLENNEYKTKYNTLLSEYEKLKISCNKFQQILNQPQPQNQNANFVNNNNINNLNNNNNKTNNQLKRILFKFDNGMELPAIAIDLNKLMDIYSLALNQMDNDDYSDINKLKFNYNGQDITNHFLNNARVKSLNLPNSSIITVDKKQIN